MWGLRVCISNKSLSSGTDANSPAQHSVVDDCFPSEMLQESILFDGHWFSFLQHVKKIIIVCLCYGEAV